MRRSLVAVSACLAVGFLPSVAQAAPDPLGSTAVTNGLLTSVAVDGSGRTYLGGEFTRVGPRMGHGVKLTTTDDSAATGFPDVWVGPTIFNQVVGSISSVVPDGTGGWFICGSFTSVGGVSRLGLAHINADGSLDATWNPNTDPDAFIRTLAISGSSLYVGGYFSSMGGQARVGIAKLSTTGTGAADPTWNPGAGDFSEGESVDAIAVSGSDVYLGGNMTVVGGQPRNAIARVSATGAGAVDATWNPNVGGGNGGDVGALAVSGTDVYVGGDYLSIGGQPRNGLAKVSTTGAGATDLTWNPSPTGGFQEIRTLAVSGTDVFAGGSFTTIGGQTRKELAKLSTTGTGAADPTWNPNMVSPSAFDSVDTVTVMGADVYVGGRFTSAGGQLRENIAKLSSTGTGAADPTWNPGADAEVTALALSGSDVYVGGYFTLAGGEPRNNIARLNADGTLDATWNPNANALLFSLLVSGSDVYAAGSFTQIGGATRQGIAKLSTSGTGAADGTWNPNAGGAVTALALSGSDLYAGGIFTSIGGEFRDRIARLSTTGTGAADPAWDPGADNQVEALAVSGPDVYAGGLFAHIGPAARSGIAKISAATGDADPTWNPNSNGDVRALAVSGTDVFAAGSFTNIGGQTRNRIAKLSASGAGSADATWNPNANNNIQALALSGSDLYVGGHFTTIGGQPRNRIARLPSTGTGAADPGWNPNASHAVRALTLSPGRLTAGGDFVIMGSLSTSRIAAFSIGAPPVDTTAPGVSIATPVDGATYTQGQVVNASYSCTDEVGGSGIATCAGPVASGAPIDTATVGPHTFTVNATDVAGNPGSDSASYTVTAPTNGNPPPPGPTGPTGLTGKRAAALKKCKKKKGRARANCIKKAKKLPV